MKHAIISTCLDSGRLQSLLIVPVSDVVENPRRLALVRGLHTAIYAVMASSVFAVFYAGVTGAHGLLFTAAMVLVALESLVFAASGLKCPLTALVAHYAPAGASVSDTFLPERFTRHTFTIFAPLMAVGFLLLLARMWNG